MTWEIIKLVLLGAVALGCVVLFIVLVRSLFTYRVRKSDFEVKEGERIPQPIRCTSRDGTVFECHPSVPVDYYGTNITVALQEIIRRMTADEIRERNSEVLKRLNGAIRKVLSFQDFKWKIKITRISAVQHFSFPSLQRL